MSAISEAEKERRIKARLDAALAAVVRDPALWNESHTVMLVRALSDAIAKELAHMWWTR